MKITYSQNALTGKTHITLASAKGLAALAKNPAAVADLPVKFKDFSGVLEVLEQRLTKGEVLVPNHIPAAKKPQATQRLIAAVRIVKQSTFVAYRMKVRELQRGTAQRITARRSTEPLAPAKYDGGTQVTPLFDRRQVERTAQRELPLGNESLAEALEHFSTAVDAVMDEVAHPFG